MLKSKTSGSGGSCVGLSFAESLHELCHSGLLVVDDHRTVSSCTPKAADALGLTLAPGTAGAQLETLPKPLADLAEEVLRTGQPLTGEELDLRVGCGRNRWLRCEALPFRPGQPGSGVILLVEDLTPVRRFNQQLDQLDRLANLGTLAASMAHEIKNALVAGKTFIDLVLEKNTEAELADVVQRELARINAIVTRMLKFAAPSPGALAAVHLHEVIEHSLRLLQPQLQGRAIELERSFRATPDLVKGDEYQLQHLFLNLLLNGFEAMNAPGRLSVETESTRPEGGPGLPNSVVMAPIRVRIKDEGSGIAPENMARLFEPFFTTKANGTGLGLPIAQRIVHDHGGTIRAESQLGHGTIFTVVLPACAAE